MDTLRYYFLIFLRRLPYFMVVATAISAISVTVALSLPPAYVSKMVLLVESPQIPQELAAPTVRTPAQEQLQIVQQRLLTRPNMLDIARRLKVLPNIDKMNADEIVEAMRARTTIRINSGRNAIPLMTISFEAPGARNAAEVLNAYLTLIQQEDSENRIGRAGETLEFFVQEVDRLSGELDTQSALILKFKQANSDALPESLEYRLTQQSMSQERLRQVERDISGLGDQRERLIQLYEITGRVETTTAERLSPEQQRLQDLRDQLNQALAVYTPENPRVKLLQARIDQLETRLGADKPIEEDEASSGTDAGTIPTALDIQLEELDSRVSALNDQKAALLMRIDALNDSIVRSPEVSITLDELERKYGSIRQQYNLAEDRLSKAKTGEQIETRSRGQRLSVIEQPAIPNQPTKPNRLLIAGGGTALGFFAGLGLVLLLELMNTTARRPEDLVNRFGIAPLTTIPYIRTRRQLFLQRGLKLLLLLVILVGVPAAIYALHIYYLPLDLIADKVMNKLGVRW